MAVPRIIIVALPLAGFLHASALAAAIELRAKLRDRTVEVSNRTYRDCAAYRREPTRAHARVCASDVYRPWAGERLQRVMAHAVDARAAFAAGDAARGTAALEDAIDFANAADREGTFVSASIATAAANVVLDALDRASLSPAERRRLLARLELASARAPFEGERIHRAWVRARSVDDGSLVEKLRAADQIARSDAILTSMDVAVTRGDLGACESAAADHASLGAAPVGLDEGPLPWCVRGLEIVKAGERLARARRDAEAVPSVTTL